MGKPTNDSTLLSIKESGRFVVQKDGQVFRRLADGTLKKVGYPVSDGRLQLKVYGTTVYVARLVWFWFNGPIPDNHEIDHKNDDRTDNRLENLQPLLRQANQMKEYRRSGNVFTKINPSVAENIRVDHSFGMKPSYLAKKYGLSESHTRAILRRKHWKD